MITANYMTDRIGMRPEFLGEPNYWNTDMGSLDAPQQIPAGSWYSVKARSHDGYYALPTGVLREQE